MSSLSDASLLDISLIFCWSSLVSKEACRRDSNRLTYPFRSSLDLEIFSLDASSFSLFARSRLSSLSLAFNWNCEVVYLLQ